MTKQRRIATTTAVSLITMAIIAIFSFGYAYPLFDGPLQNDYFKEDVLHQKQLYCIMISGILLIIVLDFIVAYGLYKYFKDDHKKLSMLSGIFRVIYTIIFSVATFYLAMNLNTHELTNEIMRLNFRRFQTIWNTGLVVFGLHILLIGYLMKLHSKIPQVLWQITLFAGISYIIVSALKLGNLDSGNIEILFMFLALPMTVGELGLAFWLLIKGGKEPKKEIKK